MTKLELGSILMGSANPDRLRDWYRTMFGIEADQYGVLDLGGVGLIPDPRDDVDAVNHEPGRTIINLHVDDARAVAVDLDLRGVDWLVPVEDREFGLIGTLIDPDGNYVQVIELAEDPEPLASSALGVRTAFSGFAVDDIEATRDFYRDTLELKVTETNGMLTLELPTGAEVLVYPKPDHTPATFTVLNLEVTDIDAAVDELGRRGVIFERYEGLPVDDRGIMREEGPFIAWFTDPAGNVISVLQDR